MTYGTSSFEISKEDDLQSTGWLLFQHAYFVVSPTGRQCGTYCSMGSEEPRGKNTSHYCLEHKCALQCVYTAATDVNKWDAPSLQVQCLRKRTYTVFTRHPLAIFSCSFH